MQGKWFERNFIIPVPHLHFVIIDWMWVAKDNLESSMMPRYLWSFILMTGMCNDKRKVSCDTEIRILARKPVQVMVRQCGYGISACLGDTNVGKQTCIRLGSKFYLAQDRVQRLQERNVKKYLGQQGQAVWGTLIWAMYPVGLNK